jgi:hypothetical protein
LHYLINTQPTFFIMHFKTFVFTAVATITALVRADCQTGKILGKFAVCGSDPVDCGFGLCCQKGATCVSDDSSGFFRCAMPLSSIESVYSLAVLYIARLTISSPTITIDDSVLLDAGCYDIVQGNIVPSSTAPSGSANTGSSGQSQTSSQNPTSKSNLSKGAIAGIVVGSVAGFVLLIAILAALLLLARRRKNRTMPEAEASRDMGERSNSSNSAIQKPAPVVQRDRSSTAKPGPVMSEIPRSQD